MVIIGLDVTAHLEGHRVLYVQREPVARGSVMSSEWIVNVPSNLRVIKLLVTGQCVSNASTLQTKEHASRQKSQTMTLHNVCSGASSSDKRLRQNGDSSGGRKEESRGRDVDGVRFWFRAGFVHLASEPCCATPRPQQDLW